jgi:hypothetical protein
VPAACAVVCALAFGILEIAGAECIPDKIWGDCNTAADLQLPVFLLGLLAAACVAAVVVLYGAVALAGRRRSRGVARGGS